MKSMHIFLSLISLLACFSINAGRPIESFGNKRPQNKQDKDGNALLHQLALQCPELTDDEFERRFLEMQGFRANPLIKNKEGKKAIDIAIENQCPLAMLNAYAGLAFGYAQGLEDGTEGTNREIVIEIQERK